MKQLTSLLGTIIFWLSWPIIHISVRVQPRTRILVVCKQEVLVVMDLIGPGRWSLPGGGLHRHESAIDGAIRELREETGIEAKPSQLKHKGRFQTVNDEHHRYTYEFFTLELSTKPSLNRQKTELRDLQWLRYQDVLTDTRTGSLVKERVLTWFSH